MKRKRGAPVGNQNAWRHGFYSAAFRQRELTDLEQNTPVDVADEIDMMRIANARLLQALNRSQEDRDIETELSILRAVCLGALSISSLVRTRMMAARVLGTIQPHRGPGSPPDGSSH